MARLTLTLLGGFSGRLDSGLPLILPTRKSQSLLAFLAVTPGTTHPRDKLAAWLWGEMPRRDGRARLRQAVFAIRRALAHVSPALVLEGNTVALDRETGAKLRREMGLEHPSLHRGG